VVYTLGDVVKFSFEAKDPDPGDSVTTELLYDIQDLTSYLISTKSLSDKHV
jgi:hypothetical protein